MKIWVWIVVIIVVLIAIWFFVFRGGDNQIADTSKETTTEETNTNTELTQEQVNQAVENLDSLASAITPEQVEESIAGFWRSLDDVNYTVDFSADGAMVEKYESTGAETQGSWILVDSSDEGLNQIMGNTAFNNEGVFLKQSLDEGRSSFYYKVVQADQDRLVYIYLDRGGVLSFQRER